MEDLISPSEFWHNSYVCRDRSVGWSLGRAHTNLPRGLLIFWKTWLSLLVEWLPALAKGGRKEEGRGTNHVMTISR